MVWINPEYILGFWTPDLKRFSKEHIFLAKTRETKSLCGLEPIGRGRFEYTESFYSDKDSITDINSRGFLSPTGVCIRCLKSLKSRLHFEFKPLTIGWTGD
jgi:hypothetical protein